MMGWGRISSCRELYTPLDTFPEPRAQMIVYTFLNYKHSKNIVNFQNVTLRVKNHVQCDGNSWKIDTFREAITSEIMKSS